MGHSMTQLIESVLGGGGQMGERMRALDWSTTALGPLEQWPQSLRISVRIVLGSGYPMTIYWGPEYTMLYNDAARQVMGTKHPAALGHGFREVFSEMWDSVGPVFDGVMTNGQDYSTLTDQLFLLNRNNYLEECYFAVSFSPIPDDTGEVGGVLGTSLETTERVIENRRRQVLRDLASRTIEVRDEDEVWRVSADTLDEHRLTIPFAFLYEYRATERKAYRVGLSVEPKEFDPVVIDCTRPNLWGFDKALAREGLLVDLGQRASILPRTSWPVPPEKADVVPIRLRENSETAGFLVVGIHPGQAFDDTYRQFIHGMAEQLAIGVANARAYGQERQRAEALAEIDRVKTAFFSNVSHEFRTPLTLMLAPLEDVLSDTGERLGPGRHELLVMVRRNAIRLLTLVNTLLDFSRIEAGRVLAVFQPTDLAGLTSDIASMFRSAIDSAGLQFSVDCQAIGEPVFVDRGMWEKIVLNLLSNALKFTFDGEVVISLKLVNGAAELQIRDTGVGIPDDQRDKVFERFHRIERTSVRTHEGTGIGLSLVQELVKLHGGSVAVTSAVGFGSTFTVTIPLGKEHLPADSIHAEQSFASSEIRPDAYVGSALGWLPDESRAPIDAAMLGEPSSLASRKAALGAEREAIVLADDNADMREYLGRLLGERYEVHAVADGRQALEAARQLRPALVLADVMMPQLDGFGLLRAIREDSALCMTPVILLSARAGEESRVEGLQADADDYLVKPFTSRELLARVATHVKMADLRRVTAEREERLRNEAELQRQKLHASQELLAQTSRLYRDLGERERESRMIVSSIPGLVAMLTPTGELEAVNEQVLAYCDRTLEELKQWRTNDTVHPDELLGGFEIITNSMKSGDPFEIVERIRRFDGAYRWFQVRGLPLRDSNGSIVRWYVLLTDIHELKRAEAELGALKDQLYKENLALRDEVDRASMFEEVVGASPTLKAVLSRIAKVAPTDSTVFVSGETGTGKELIARAVHKRSKRSGRVFVSVNCAALAPTLISSELFGHEKGAFTGATQRRLGRFELADGGTIFLDEVGELLPETQVALLRVLQEREFERVGGTQPIHVDVRVIAATNRDLKAAIGNGSFRQDLYYRLNVFPVEVPPLRERKDDLLMLVEYFVQRYADRAGKQIRSIDKRTLDLLQAYDWPGNIRELQNVIERSVILSSGGVFAVDELWLSAQSFQAAPQTTPPSPLHGDMRSEREIIEAALAQSRGRIAGPSGAAARLNIPASTLEYKIKSLNIRKGQFKFGGGPRDNR
jgi:PAS domain S-box-containing protein